MAASGLRQLLISSGLCSKAVAVEETSSCTLLFCESRVNMLIAFSTYDDWVYIKAVPELAVQPHMWHCNEVYYTPYGLYAFAKSHRELIEKLKAKQHLLAAQHKLAIERLSAIEEAGF
ncbi:hypothetical protein [Hyperthermus butylicus]|uniref:Uncharacterized protein n=1 Tax=Hyperthermus butylicus (strain DSM 5456 / JCM 9403 / PLM1-5) TaxID=415426 RepID=A2BJS2_HYPBU|nr:hypothetical protein [Hyperthermus butylicus]ABM80233.1 hypothetical protein Hbut_0361 [Hyperthermus butylicus DSM 5456]